METRLLAITARRKDIVNMSVTLRLTRRLLRENKLVVKQEVILETQGTRHLHRLMVTRMEMVLGMVNSRNRMLQGS